MLKGFYSASISVGKDFVLPHVINYVAKLEDQ
jgi:hypothetical protein